MKPISILSIIILVCAFISCETEIPFNGKETKPQLTVNCLACTDSIIKVKVTASRFFLSNETEFKVITDATIHLYVNGAFKENLVSIGEGAYESNYAPTEGDVVRVEVSATGYDATWTEETFPSAVGSFQIDTTQTNRDTIVLTRGGYGDSNLPLDTVGISYNANIRFNVKFSDPSVQKNYYRLVVHYLSKYGGYNMENTYLSSFDDIVFGTKKDNLDGIITESSNDPYNIFSDELIDGKTHTISFNYDFNINEYTIPIDPNALTSYSITVDLQSISKSYYLYLKSLNALSSSSSFLSEQVQVYTNVNNGLGIYGTRTNQLRKYILPK